MSKFYRQVQKAPIKYVDYNGEFKKLKLQAIKDVNIPNSFNIPYVRGVVGLFNAIISRMMYFSEYGANNSKRSFPSAQEYIYFPAHQISEIINRCESQSYNIIRSLERILDIHVNRANEKAGANKFRLSERAIEFLHIFTPEKLEAFMLKFEIEPEDQYALKQLYNYRVVRPTDGNMDREQREEYSKFIKHRKHRNFLHFCARNNESVESRIAQIEINIDLLSNQQKEQLAKIKQSVADGVKKLVNRLHWKLVELQQFITLRLKRNKLNNIESSEEASQSLTNSESNNKETVEHASATRAAQRIPADEPSPGDIIEITATWNNVVRGQENIPHIETMDHKTYNAICNQVKSYGKETIITSIKKVTGLHSVSSGTYQMTLGKFMTKKTLDIILTSKIKEDIESEWFDDYLADMDHKEIISSIELNSIPHFTTSEDAITWWNNKLSS